MGAGTQIGVAVTTVGRWDALRNLLGDLAAQSIPPRAVAIAQHNPDASAELDAVIAPFTDRLDIRTAVSPRGISNGRNAAAEKLGEDVDWLWFPNDNSRVAPDFIEKVSAHCVDPTTVCAVKLVDREGPRTSLPAPGSPLTRRNVWGAIEAAMFFRRTAFEAVGAFDRGIGSGADTPWQSGEGTDLILRLAERDDFSIVWVDDIVIEAEVEFGHLTPEEQRRKLRRYGRGAGNILRRWHYPLWYKAAFLLAAALKPIRERDKFGVPEAWSLLVGRTEGLVGRTFTRDTDYRAVLR